jgi:hypothetical protein
LPACRAKGTTGWRAGANLNRAVPYAGVGGKRNHGIEGGGWERRLAEVSTRQGGIVSLDQLRGLGLSDSAAMDRAGRGGLHRVYHGVYTVGHRSIGRAALLRAATLACGDGAVISHATAAAFWGIRDRWPVSIDVIVSCEQGRKIDGIRARRCRYPDDEEITLRAGVTCTTPSRTLVDIAGSFGTPSLRRAVEMAAVLKLLDLPALDQAMTRAKGRRGMGALHEILTPWRTPDGAVPDLRSVFEALVLPRLVAMGLPRPSTNVRLDLEGERLTVDFIWEEQRLVVETDGEETHGTPVAFRRDRKRDQLLLAAGFRVARVTWDQMRDEPEGVVARIAAALAAGA